MPGPRRWRWPRPSSHGNRYAEHPCRGGEWAQGFPSGETAEYQSEGLQSIQLWIGLSSFRLKTATLRNKPWALGHRPLAGSLARTQLSPGCPPPGPLSFLEDLSSKAQPCRSNLTLTSSSAVTWYAQDWGLLPLPLAWARLQGTRMSISGVQALGEEPQSPISSSDGWRRVPTSCWAGSGQLSEGPHGPSEASCHPNFGLKASKSPVGPPRLLARPFSSGQARRATLQRGGQMRLAQVWAERTSVGSLPIIPWQARGGTAGHKL